VEGAPERFEQLACPLVLGVGGTLGQVAGDEHGCGARPHAVDRPDRRLDRGDRIVALPVGAQVEIAELDE
jgi:hypothetical protein